MRTRRWSPPSKRWSADADQYHSGQHHRRGDRAPRYLSVCRVSVEALREYGGKSVLEELMDDFMAMLASFSGRFYQLRSQQNQQRVLDAAARRLSGY